MTIKEIKRHHEIAEKYHYQAFEAREVFRQAHEDREELLDTLNDSVRLLERALPWLSDKATITTADIKTFLEGFNND